MRNEMGAASVKSACTLQSSYSSVGSPSRHFLRLVVSVAQQHANRVVNKMVQSMFISSQIFIFSELFVFISKFEDSHGFLIDFSY